MVGALVRKATGLVADYAHQPGLTEPSATQLYDYSRWKNHGTFKADGHPDWVQLPSGLWVMDFDGTDDVITIPDSAGLRTPADTDEITVEIWGKISLPAKWPDIVSKYNAYEIYIEPGYFGVWLYLDGGRTRPVKAAYSDAEVDNQWCHFAFTRTTAGLTIIYLNGRNIGEGIRTGDLQDGELPLLIGRLYALYFLDGLIALPRIYNRALSAGKIKQIYESERYWFGV